MKDDVEVIVSVERLNELDPYRKWKQINTIDYNWSFNHKTKGIKTEVKSPLVKDLPAYADMRIVGVKCTKCQEYKGLRTVEGKRIPEDCGQEDCPNKVLPDCLDSVEQYSSLMANNWRK